MLVTADITPLKMEIMGVAMYSWIGGDGLCGEFHETTGYLGRQHYIPTHLPMGKRELTKLFENYSTWDILKAVHELRYKFLHFSQCLSSQDRMGEVLE